MHSSSATIAVALILSCGLLGGYASMFTCYHHGFLDALRTCTSTSSSLREQCVLDMTHSPTSPRRRYTHIPTIDSMISVLLEFFGQGLKSQSTAETWDLEALLAFSYLAAQFGGAWALMALEGLRRANSGTLLSWTGSFGITFQAVTITIIAPIYLSLQLLQSPSASPSSAILVDSIDLVLLPASTIIAFAIPTIGLVLPLLGVLSPEANYICITLWQPFPLYQTAIHYILRLFWRNPKIEVGTGAVLNHFSYRKKLGRAYKFILCLTMGIYLLVISIIVISATTDILPSVSAIDILAPTSVTSPPTLALQDPPVSATDSREIVVSFLRWDVYCACASLVIWAAYLSRSVQQSYGFVATFAKVVLWTVAGGPITPAVVLLWERDIVVLKRSELLGKNKKWK